MKKSSDNSQALINQLSANDKAAILLSTLGLNVTKMVFQYLPDADIKNVLEKMNQLKKVPHEVVNALLKEFYNDISENNQLLFNQDQDPQFLRNVLGEERFQQLYQGNQFHLNKPKLDALDLVDDKTLSNFLFNEHPQTVALIITHLPALRKMEVFKKLPQGMQIEVLTRMSQFDTVPPDHIHQLNEILKAELSHQGFIKKRNLGGTQEVAQVLNLLDKSAQQNLLKTLGEKDPELAAIIQKQMLVFEDILLIHDSGIKVLLQKIDHKVWVLALKMASDEIKNKIFKNMSQKMSLTIKEDIESCPPTKKSVLEQAQGQILEKIKELEKKGQITIERGGAEEEKYV